jgi:hypothetical protein
MSKIVHDENEYAIMSSLSPRNAKQGDYHVQQSIR